MSAQSPGVCREQIDRCLYKPLSSQRRASAQIKTRRLSLGDSDAELSKPKCPCGRNAATGLRHHKCVNRSEHSSGRCGKSMHSSLQNTRNALERNACCAAAVLSGINAGFCKSRVPVSYLHIFCSESCFGHSPARPSHFFPHSPPSLSLHHTQGEEKSVSRAAQEKVKKERTRFRTIYMKIIVRG